VVEDSRLSFYRSVHRATALIASLALVLQLALAPFGHAMALRALLAATPSHRADHVEPAHHGHGGPAQEPGTRHVDCPACLAASVAVAIPASRAGLPTLAAWWVRAASGPVVAAVAAPGLAVTIPPVRGPPLLQA